MPTKTETIARFLNLKARVELAKLYNHDMEVQVNVAQDRGNRISGDYKGRSWLGWTDGVTTWKPFRIPLNAKTDPTYEDSDITYDLAEHAEGIGMTGWDWKNKVSKWIAFDFDAIVGERHRESGLSSQELESVKKTAHGIPWITLRRSTSGAGLHLYVFLDNYPTCNHTEHAALARAILGVMSALTGFDFSSKVDVCGGNMWVWHRKMEGTDGLTLIKQGNTLPEELIPRNWRDHIKVITGHRRKNLPQVIEESGTGENFEELTGQRQFIELDDDHKKLIDWLKDNNALWWWDQDHHMLVSHTKWLERAHESLKLRGVFKTSSSGTDLDEQNCFSFPLRRGVWAVRRYTPGVSEHDSWSQDGAGWTRCYLNKEPDLATACRAKGGIEDTKGGFQFREAEVAIQAVQALGIIPTVGRLQMSRKTRVYQHRDGRIVIEVERDAEDVPTEMQGWLPERKEWTKIFNAPVTAPTESEIGNYDDLVRHLVTSNSEDSGWMIHSDGHWRAEPLTHVKVALTSLGLSNKESSDVIGSSVMKCWTLVNNPFQNEYPGNREWNKTAAQFRYVPIQETDNLSYPTWMKVLEHCGQGLNEAIKENGWAKANGILTGAEYLKCWVASIFQEPTEPLPFLFFYGPEDCGKSIFHEALSLLITKGCQRADVALSDSTDFNGELEGAILCVIEETDLHNNRRAMNRIKDWVTSKQLNIRHMYRTPYHIQNTTHWVQCNNSHLACPIFPGDTRIVMCYVKPLDPVEMIPKKRLLVLLEKEAQHFITAVMSLDLPPSIDRLNIPVITTEDKKLTEQMNQSTLQRFITEKCISANGCKIKFSDFYDRFVEWMEPNEISFWTKNRVGREFPPQFPKARFRKDGQFYIGNIAWAGTKSDEESGVRLIVKDDYLFPADQPC